jgi:hypothetical protein
LRVGGGLEEVEVVGLGQAGGDGLGVGHGVAPYG